MGDLPKDVISAGELNPRDRIVRAAVETIARDKISGTRMREIAKRSGISQGHLHYYFSAKSSLFLAVLQHLLETFVAERRAALCDASVTPDEKMKVFLEQETELIRHFSDLLLVRLDFLVQGTRDPAVEAKVREMYATWRHDIMHVVVEGVEAGVFCSDYAPLIPNLLIALMEGAFLQFVNEPDSTQLLDYFAAAHEMVLRLLAPTELPPSSGGA